MGMNMAIRKRRNNMLIDFKFRKVFCLQLFWSSTFSSALNNLKTAESPPVFTEFLQTQNFCAVIALFANFDCNAPKPS
jgi:hypothetical protein